MERDANIIIVATIVMSIIKGPTMELEKYMGVNVQRAALKLNNYYQKVVNPFDITVDQWEILVVLWEKEGITQKSLLKDCTRIRQTLHECFSNWRRKNLFIV